MSKLIQIQPEVYVLLSRERIEQSNPKAVRLVWFPLVPVTLFYHFRVNKWQLLWHNTSILHDCIFTNRNNTIPSQWGQTISLWCYNSYIKGGLSTRLSFVAYNWYKKCRMLSFCVHFKLTFWIIKLMLRLCLIDTG